MVFPEFESGAGRKPMKIMARGGPRMGGKGRNFSFTRVLKANPVVKAGSLFP